MDAPQSLPWSEPLEFARRVAEPYWVLLYSGVRDGESGRFSYLACDMAQKIEAADFSALEAALSGAKERFADAWFGYLGYGLKDCLEELPEDEPGWVKMADMCMMRFFSVYVFDHQEKVLTLWSARGGKLAGAPRTLATLPEVGNLRSNMSKGEYLEKAARVIDSVRAGDLYQANLTRKFMGDFAQVPDAFSLFARLCEVSPAAYSAFLQMGDVSVLSSSPEEFLRIGADGSVHTRPIKGTAARSDDPATDAALRAGLERSDKDRAENLMIVDLMRNDLSKSCTNVKVDRLFEVTSHATIHHMSSSISAQKRTECSALGVVKDCFPPGSMTGAPKIKAMALCSELERQERGIYSGAIGWFGGDGSAELSVVIRTLVLKGRTFEFQVGGGIVSDSTPQRELTELLDKAKGMLAALGVARERIESL